MGPIWVLWAAADSFSSIHRMHTDRNLYMGQLMGRWNSADLKSEKQQMLPITRNCNVRQSNNKVVRKIEDQFSSN